MIFFLNLSSSHQVLNHAAEHLHLSTFLVGKVRVKTIEIPPSEATLGILQVLGRLRVQDDDVVSFGVFVEVCLADVLHSDEVGLLGASVEVEVEVALGRGAGDGGVGAVGGD